MRTYHETHNLLLKNDKNVIRYEQTLEVTMSNNIGKFKIEDEKLKTADIISITIDGVM